MPGSLTCNTPRDDEEVTVKYGNLKTLEDERNAYADAADEFERQNALLKAEIEQLKHEKRKAEADTKHEKREKEIMIEKRDGLRLSNEVLMPSIEILIGFPKASKRSYSETNQDLTPIPPPNITPSLARRIVVCIQCYRHKRRCDLGEPCQSCIDNGHRCQRAKCEDYEDGACKRQSCLRAQASDEMAYKNLKWVGHVAKDNGERPRSKKAKRGGGGAVGGS